MFPKPVIRFNVALLLILGTSCQTKNSFGQWTISTATKNDADLTWIKFLWTNDSLGNRYFERTAMFVPAKIDGLPYNLLFQFDLGADITRLYGRPLAALCKKHPAFNRIKRYKSALQFWKSQMAFRDLTLAFEGTKANTENCFVMKDFGENIAAADLTDSSPIKLGSIGADLFHNKILVLDYPNQCFAICDNVPNEFHASFVNMSLDKHGRVVIPLQLKGKSYRVLFDNGSSIFPLLVTDDKIAPFSKAKSTDTIAISSWGTVHNVTGRPVKERLQLAGKSFSDVMIYTDHRQEARNENYDAIAGNALFWNNVVIIDFKNKLFGVK